MIISVYSLFTSLLWFNLFVFLFYLLRKKWGVALGYHYLPLMIAVALCLFRLLIPIETPYTKVLRSYHVLPQIQSLFQAPIIQVDPVTVSFGTFLISAFSLISLFLLVRLWRILRKEYKAMLTIPRSTDERLINIFQEVKEVAPSRRRCDLIVSKRYKEPFICGVGRSVIVFPESMMKLSDQDLYFILKHEWQHHLNRDNQVKLGIEILCCILWWNPFVYLFRNNLSQTLELKCDRKITKHLAVADKLNYMGSLFRVMCLIYEEPDAVRKDKTLTSIYYLGAFLRQKDRIDQDTIQRFELATGAGKHPAGIACVICFVALFSLSFGFVIQPASLPSSDELYSDSDETAEIQMISVTPENAYLLDRSDGTYALYVDGKLFRTMGKEEVQNEAHAFLPIKTIDNKEKIS